MICSLSLGCCVITASCSLSYLSDMKGAVLSWRPQHLEVVSSPECHIDAYSGSTRTVYTTRSAPGECTKVIDQVMKLGSLASQGCGKTPPASW
jgi:hypothetical protein